MTKRCSKCGQEKDVAEFNPHSRGSKWLRGKCKQCEKEYKQAHYLKHRAEYNARGRQRHAEHRKEANERRKEWYRHHKEYSKRKMQAYSLQHNYGLSISQRVAMYTKQDGCCPICGQPVPYSKMKTEHDHNTGKVRGLTCNRCNFLVGVVESCPDLLSAARQYIEAHK